MTDAALTWKYRQYKLPTEKVFRYQLASTDFELWDWQQVLIGALRTTCCVCLVSIHPDMNACAPKLQTNPTRCEGSISHVF